MKIIFLLFIFFSFVKADVPRLGMYIYSHNNTYIKFRMIKTDEKFFCKPYGIFTIDDLIDSKDLTKECRASVDDFYKKKPKLKFFSILNLHRKQNYHIVKKDKLCIFYSNSTKSYSEEMLENGIAVITPFFQDKEWKYRFFRAEQGARINKQGLWSNRHKLLKACMTTLHKQ
ncbi:MAG: hypothetical protein GQ570_01400 [Helicobacteraceae bacterium]|nr:hypothetical protein [Helicobacteraceae bacterium]